MRRRRMCDPAVGLLLLVAVALGLCQPVGAGGPCWPPPVDGVVVDPFRDPGCVWCPGNRGIEYEVEPGAAVRAVAAGTVTFSGEVAGERYVVVELASGWKLTYGRVASTTLAAGAPVARGDDRRAARRTGSCSGSASTASTPTRRRSSARTSGDGVWFPIDGRPARPAPPPRLRCGADQR